MGVKRKRTYFRHIIHIFCYSTHFSWYHFFLNKLTIHFLLILIYWRTVLMKLSKKSKKAEISFFGLIQFSVYWKARRYLQKHVLYLIKNLFKHYKSTQILLELLTLTLHSDSHQSTMYRQHHILHSYIKSIYPNIKLIILAFTES